jgi:hypothetical protein
MAITFIKHQKFEPKNVKEQDFDIDNNWSAKSITFESETQNDHEDVANYTLQLLHNKTQKITSRMHISIKLYRHNQYGGNLMEVHIKEAGDNYGYAYSRHAERQRNIFIFLKKAVKNIEFIKGMYQMRRATQRETFKTFGKIFISER